MSLPLRWLARKSVTSADPWRRESLPGSRSGRPQTRRIGGGAAAAEGKLSHTQTPQSRLLPTAGTFRWASWVRVSATSAVVLSHAGITIQHTHTQTKKTSQTGNRKDYFYGTHSTNSTLLTVSHTCNPTLMSVFAESDDQHALIVCSTHTHTLTLPRRRVRRVFFVTGNNKGHRLEPLYANV